MSVLAYGVSIPLTPFTPQTDGHGLAACAKSETFTSGKAAEY